MSELSSIRFGKAACRACGHHPIMHVTEQQIMTGKPGPCEGAKAGEAPCTCMRYEGTAGEEPMLVGTFKGEGEEVGHG